MISEKHTIEEFGRKVPEFAQALANRVSERNPNAKVKVRAESPLSYLITIENGHKEEHYQLAWTPDGIIESQSVYMV